MDLGFLFYHKHQHSLQTTTHQMNSVPRRAFCRCTSLPVPLFSYTTKCRPSFSLSVCVLFILSVLSMFRRPFSHYLHIFLLPFHSSILCSNINLFCVEYIFMPSLRDSMQGWSSLGLVHFVVVRWSKLLLTIAWLITYEYEQRNPIQPPSQQK